MSQGHKGNTQPAISQEEHASVGGIDAKKVFVFDNAGNQITSFGGQGSSTVAIGSAPTIFAVVNTSAAGQASVVLDIGKSYFGLATVDIGTQNKVGLNAGINSIGFASVTPIAAWPDPKTYIGLVTITGSLAAAAGNVTLDAGSKTGIIGNITLSDPKTFIGSVSVGGIVDSKGFIGLVSIGGGLSNVGVVGNVTISDSKGFIGLVTTVPAYGSNSTIYTGIISSTGFATVLVAPASNRFFIKNTLISSLGRAEVEIRSGATTLIPFTSLSTTGGYVGNWGEQGLPARAQTDALVLNLNGGATIAYMFHVRFEA